MMISIEFKKGKNEFNDFGRYSETSYIVAGLSLDIADVEACQFNSIKSAITSKFTFYSKREIARLPALAA